MYCKNCGRQLKEGMRFCDRCGQSVRKNQQSSQATKRQEIEELKAERLNRKKRLEEKEAKQNRTKRRKKNKSSAAIVVVAFILIAVLSFLIGYAVLSPKNAADSINSEPVPENAYETVKINGITCPYPSDFHENTVSGNEHRNLTDALGGATMVISTDGKSGEAVDLMKEYIAEVGGDVTSAVTGNDYYAVTLAVGEKIHHRKCMIKNGIEVYYNFEYNAGSPSEEKYAEYIEYIDKNFK